jgi:spore maturation protein SpmB
MSILLVHLGVLNTPAWNVLIPLRSVLSETGAIGVHLATMVVSRRDRFKPTIPLMIAHSFKTSREGVKMVFLALLRVVPGSIKGRLEYVLYSDIRVYLKG